MEQRASTMLTPLQGNSLKLDSLAHSGQQSHDFGLGQTSAHVNDGVDLGTLHGNGLVRPVCLTSAEVNPDVTTPRLLGSNVARLTC